MSYTDFKSQIQLPYYKNINSKLTLDFHDNKDFKNLLKLLFTNHKDICTELHLLFQDDKNFRNLLKLLFTQNVDILSQIDLRILSHFSNKFRIHFRNEVSYILPSSDIYIDPDDTIHKSIYLQADKNGFGYNKILMKFDLTDYTETTPQSLLHLYNLTDGWDNATISIYRILEDWDDVSARNDILTDDYPVVTTDISNIGEYTLDITSLTNGWINGTYQNYGLLITYTDNNYLTYRNFGSTRHPLNQYHPYLSLDVYNFFIQKMKLIQSPAPLIDSWAIQTAWQSRRISWEKPKDARLIGYNAYRSSDGGNTWEQMNSVLIPADTTYFIITGMDALASNQWVSAITSVIKYGDQTEESDKQISRDVWGVRYLIDWPDVADSYVIYKA